MFTTTLRRAACAAGVAIAFTFALVACSAAWPSGDDGERARHAPPTPQQAVDAELVAGLGPIIEYGELVEERETILYAHALVVDRYADAVAQARAEAAALAALSYEEPEPEASYSAPVSSGGGGGSCSAIPSHIVQAESGGDPNAQNPSGAFGCYQLMPEHFNGGACSDLGRDQAGQDECASRLWDGGAGCGNWAATGGCG